jgi:SSS family solute:Na+ symporter
MNPVVRPSLPPVLLAIFIALPFCCGSIAPAAENTAQVTPGLREQAVHTLRDVLENEQRWVKVHAAEFLLELDYPDGVETAFLKELEAFGEEPEYRIGIWRVLAKATYAPKQRSRWIAQIRDVFLDPDAPDRLHAAETLAKLGYRIRETTASAEARTEREAFERAAAGADGMAVFARWMLVGSDPARGDSSLRELLASDDARVRGLTAYAVRHLPAISPATQQALVYAAETEPEDSSWRVHVVCAMAVHGPAGSRAKWTEELQRYTRADETSERYQACQTLARLATEDELPLLLGRLDDEEADVRSAAGYAVLRVGRRAHHALFTLDWIVIGLYAVAMLSVGWYYSRRTATTEDYLLGGRKMNPLNVGLSLFATLLSTITYLAFPGEMIRYGPMILAMIVAYPFVALVVGWLMIPFFMRLQVTSAYQILEMRLGLGVRMLGSIFFLSLRLLWMAVIVYATTDKVLVPLIGLDSSATPWLCAVLGLITVTYTSMGGLRAVVVTDVMQTLILLGGAVLTIVLATIYLGGVGAWWPQEWPAHWPEPKLYDPNERITFFAIVLATFTWWSCTSGSDQMAIQRYLATRDVRAARAVLVTTLGVNVLINCLLTLVGLALLAYFRLNPHLIPDGQTILGNADQLFPQFIALGLPVGLSGLVVAGLLAAAMSSLSSGVNSSCSVITVDFIDRFRRSKENELDHVRLAKYVSVLVGIVVVVLSAYVGAVQGNLLEVTYKVVNMITVPLFGLFFMAIFVPWSKGWATIVGAITGLAVVITINFWKELTGSGGGISFLWAMPLSFVAQTLVGSLLSLLPFGRRRTLGSS